MQSRDVVRLSLFLYMSHLRPPPPPPPPLPCFFSWSAQTISMSRLDYRSQHKRSTGPLMLATWRRENGASGLTTTQTPWASVTSTIPSASGTTTGGRRSTWRLTRQWRTLRCFDHTFICSMFLQV